MIEIQQALFGYRDGHNLVASSIPLPTRERLLLAKVTDSSGPENLPGFESPITGLPIPDFGYALFCTWNAPEMPRPGCVWSHVLLIKFADLDQIQDLSTLRSLFARPCSGFDASSYSRSLTIDPLAKSKSLTSDWDSLAKKAQIVLQLLYEHPKVDGVVLDESSSGWDDAIFAVWSQQWKSLRRGFGFATASLGDRRVGGVQCAIQIAPASKGRFWRKSAPSTLVCDPATVKARSETLTGDWVDIALAGLKTARNGFREFLGLFGDDLPPTRSSFAPLCDIYSRFENKGLSRKMLLLFVGQVFPDRIHAGLLKAKLLDGSTPDQRGNPQTLLEILDFLLGYQEASAYEAIGFDFKAATSTLWEQERDGLLDLLLRELGNEPTKPLSEVLYTVSLNANSGTLQTLARDRPPLVPALIRYNWKMANEVDTWRLNQEIQSKVFEALADLSLNTQEWASVMGAMFLAATPVCIRESIERSGSDVMSGAFQWLHNPVCEHLLPSNLWRSALSEKAENAVSSGECHGPAQFALAVWLAAPWRILSVPGLDHFVEAHFREGAMSKVPPPLRLFTSFLVLTVALRTGGKPHLIPQSLFTVHDALASGGYSHESWDIISSHLPDLGWWKSWDRCERLRRAVKNYYQAYPNERLELIKAAATATELEVALNVTR